MEDEGTDAGNAGQREIPVCPGCMAENDPAADFCVKCGQPLSTIATTDPFRQTLSEGYWYRTAASGRIKPIVFWGTWLVFLPTIIGLAAMLANLVGLPWEEADDTARRAILILLIGASLLVVGVLLWRMTRNYRAVRLAERNDRE